MIHAFTLIKIRAFTLIKPFQCQSSPYFKNALFLHFTVVLFYLKLWNTSSSITAQNFGRIRDSLEPCGLSRNLLQIRHMQFFWDFLEKCRSIWSWHNKGSVLRSFQISDSTKVMTQGIHFTFVAISLTKDVKMRGLVLCSPRKWTDSIGRERHGYSHACVFLVSSIHYLRFLCNILSSSSPGLKDQIVFTILSFLLRLWAKILTAATNSKANPECGWT